MKNRFLAAASLVLLTTVIGPAQKMDQPNKQAASAPVVLVELFTSEGCSTCPPADKLLSEIDRDQTVKGVEVIALSEHVDYWNRLGWKDPFSSAQFSQRQNDYSRALGLEDVYTPQMVVDGQTAFVGSKRSIALNTIAKAGHSPKADVRINVASSVKDSIKVEIQVENLPEVSKKDKAEVMIAVTENGLLSDVSRGENKGKTLGHSAVTRKLTKLTTIEGKSFSGDSTIHLDSSWKRENLRIAVFIQERESRRVIGAKSISVSGV